MAERKSRRPHAGSQATGVDPAGGTKRRRKKNAEATAGTEVPAAAPADDRAPRQPREPRPRRRAGGDEGHEPRSDRDGHRKSGAARAPRRDEGHDGQDAHDAHDGRDGHLEAHRDVQGREGRGGHDGHAEDEKDEKDDKDEDKDEAAGGDELTDLDLGPADAPVEIVDSDEVVELGDDAAEAMEVEHDEVSAPVPAGRGSLAKRDPMAVYMRETRRYPLLTPDEEHDLATRLVEHGDTQAARKLIEANL
ncbi:MAG TPA: sigma-70 factor domain-containing protein, partial [Kofleriaceae bacterium]|nr:sigma-70 factor domain-containing protein [Kofleriaceae bacterium]